MAQEPESERNASGIARTSKRKWGYDSEQVDAFLERAHMLYEGEGAQLTQHDIQNVSFDLVKGGYVIAQVDAALARLERAVVDKQTTWEISQHGRVAWKAQTESLFRQLDAHSKREHGERFKPGEGKEPSYDRKQVDRIVDQCLTKAAGELGVEEVSEDDAKKLVDLNSQTVANVIFTQRKGKRGYDERQVDYYLNECVQLLTRLESYARVADFVGEPSESAMTAANPSATSLASQETQVVSPLFAVPAVSAEPIAQPAQVQNSTDSFDALNKAEREIFTTPATSPGEHSGHSNRCADVCSRGSACVPANHQHPVGSGNSGSSCNAGTSGRSGCSSGSGTVVGTPVQSVQCGCRGAIFRRNGNRSVQSAF